MAILGGTGYVAGELLRLLALHPVFEPAAVVSESAAGAAGRRQLPAPRRGLAGARLRAPGRRSPSCSPGEPRVALFRRRRHGASAPMVAEALDLAEEKGCELHVVDLSADFRFADPVAYAAVYGHAHGAAGRQAQFFAGLPEHVAGAPAPHVGHPGCFVTSVLLPVVALLRRGIAEPSFAVTGLTGSTGAGRSPSAKTHHPERRSNVAAYSPLAHRHEPEMVALRRGGFGHHARRSSSCRSPVPRPAASTPRSTPPGPAAVRRRGARGAARGIRRRALRGGAGRAAAAPGGGRHQSPPPGRGRARRAPGRFSALDNLVKGAAGGGLQWMNRLFGLADDTGLSPARSRLASEEPS